MSKNSYIPQLNFQNLQVRVGRAVIVEAEMIDATDESAPPLPCVIYVEPALLKKALGIWLKQFHHVHDETQAVCENKFERVDESYTGYDRDGEYVGREIPVFRVREFYSRVGAGGEAFRNAVQTASARAEAEQKAWHNGESENRSVN